MKKLSVLFVLLLCLFINEISAQKIYYSTGEFSINVFVNGTEVLNNASNSGELDIAQYLTHTSDPWDIITIYASGDTPLSLFAGEYGLPTYSIENEPTYEASFDHVYASYSCTWALGANDMYIEVNPKVW
ncbi:hypothetical protein ABS764_10380 [Flavobacterium sp. ST-87]|uniref:Uncharacterized protein n=1 Tax=Flavobacterium plantiphilum TaxID=3163297 RepID=A0ABW8XTM3_9FLAO